MAAGDNVSFFMPANVQAVAGTTQTALNINDILDDTAEIGTAGAGLTAINLPNQTMDITGDLSGSVGSVTGAVGSVGGNVDGSVGSVTGDIGGIVAAGLTNDAFADGAIDAAVLATDTITAAKIAANAIGASELATDAIGAAQLAADAVDRNDADASDISVSTVSDDATTFVRGEWGT